MSKQFLGERELALEAEFFRRVETEKLARLRAERQKQRTVQELAKASGVSDEAVLRELVELGISAEVLAAVALVPLVRVAWADGEIQDSERSTIANAAEKQGIAADSGARELLESWLHEQPGDELYSAWREYVSSLTESMSDSHVAALRDQVVRQATDVATAAGGIFKKVAHSESHVLKEIKAAFDG